MKKFLLFLMLFSLSAFADPQRMDRDIKLPTQKVIEFQKVTAPIVATTNYIVTSTTNSSSTNPLVVTSFAHQPDVPRALTVTCGGTSSDIAAGNVVISGTDFYGHSISDTLAITLHQAGTTTGVKAFKTVTSVSIPPGGGAGTGTYVIGVSGYLGLAHCINAAVDVIQAGLAGTYETTHPTAVANTSVVSQNVVLLNSSLNGSDVQLYYMQNFRCLH